MEVSPLVWGLTIAFIVGLLVFDFYFHVRKAHVPTLREAAIWSALYVGIAILFGFGVLVFGGPTPGGEYFAGYITEKALSVDNLFVFLIIMSSFRVPREDQQKVLLFGIAFALVARTGFIFLGAALINSFAWVFYLFGLILILTAGNRANSTGRRNTSIAEACDGTTEEADAAGACRGAAAVGRGSGDAATDALAGPSGAVARGAARFLASDRDWDHDG
jgi:TerC family integral membrane protein